MKTLMAFVRKYRWPVVGLSIAVLWLMGYASLTFIWPDQPVTTDSAEPLAPDGHESHAVLAEAKTHEHAADSSPTGPADSANQPLAVNRSNCRELSQAELNQWLEQGLASASSDYEQGLNKLKIESGLRGLLAGSWLEAETDKLKNSLSITQNQITEEYEQQLELPVC